MAQDNKKVNSCDNQILNLMASRVKEFERMNPPSSPHPPPEFEGSKVEEDP